MNDFDYFQLVMLALFYTVFFGRGFVMRLTKKTYVIPPNLGKGYVSLVIEKSFMVVWVLFAIYIFAYSMHIEAIMIPSLLHTPLFDNQPVRIIAALTLVGGYCFFVWAIASISDSWRMGVDNVNPGPLMTGGAFRISRNPAFLFMDVYFVATFLINGSFFFLILALIMILGIHYQIIQEEKSLTARYGQTYLDYKTLVRRYL